MLDVSDKANPTLVAEWDTLTVHDLAFEYPYIYVATSYKGLHIGRFNEAGIHTVKVVGGGEDTMRIAREGGEIKKIALDGERLFVLMGKGLVAYDINERESPVEMEKDFGERPPLVHNMFARDGVLYITPCSEGLSAFDVSGVGTGAPEVGQIVDFAGVDVYVKGNYMYLAHEGDGTGWPPHEGGLVIYEIVRE